jgi:hypothetical protein
MNQERRWAAGPITMTRKEEGQMIKVSVLYPNEEGKRLVALSIGDLIKTLSISPLVQFHKLWV